MIRHILVSLTVNRNWLGCWTGIEINLISFLPSIIDRLKMFRSEYIIKYFIVQIIASGILFISIPLISSIEIILLILIRLITKIGCPPFHLCFPSVMEGLTWFSCFILRTIQNVTPIIFLTYLNINITVYIVIAGIWGSVRGLGYSSMRKIISLNANLLNCYQLSINVSFENKTWIGQKTTTNLSTCSEKSINSKADRLADLWKLINGQKQRWKNGISTVANCEHQNKEDILNSILKT